MTPQPGLAIFKGDSGVVTVDASAGGVAVTGMRFVVDGYTLGGNDLGLVGGGSNAPTIEVGDGTSASAGYSVVASNVLTGDDGLIKDGYGTLVLTGDNAYAGGTIIGAGTLQIGVGGTSGSIVGNVADGGTLVFDRSDTVTYAGVISGGGALTQAGTGTLALTGKNVYTGGTVIQTGTLALVGDGSIVDSGSIEIDDNGTLDISGTFDGATLGSFSGSGSVVLGAQTLAVTNDSLFRGIISGSGGLTVANAYVTLAGVNTYTGLTTIDHGAQLHLGAINETGSVAGDILDNGSLSFDGGDLTYGGVISGTGSVEKFGAGTLTLTGANTFTGGLMVTGTAGDSVLTVSSDANLGASGVKVDLQGGTLDATATFTLERPLNLVSNPARGADVLQVDYGATLTVAKGIAGGSSDSLIKSGSGTLVLASTAGYGGSTTISEGTLALEGGGSLAASSDIRADGTLDISGMTAGATIQSLSGAGAVTLGAKTLTLSNAGDEFSGVISGSGALTLSGGTQVLSGTNTYRGGTNIYGGVLQVSSDANLGLLGDVVIDNGTLQAGASFTLSHGIEIQNTAHIDTNGHALTLAGPMGWAGPGHGTLSKEGLGTLTITSIGPDPYELVNVQAGTLAFYGPDWSYGGVMGFGAGFLSLANGAVFDSSQAGIDPEVRGLDGAGTIALGAQRLNIQAGTESWTYGGAIVDGGIGGGSGGGVLMNEPSVTGTLTGVNTYTGLTDIRVGTLALAGHGSIVDSSGVYIDGGGILDLSATSEGATIKDLWGSGAVALGARTLTVSDATGMSFNGFDGIISGTGGLVLSGGTLVLGGANTYTGDTTIAAGAVLQLGSGISTASIVGDVIDDGVLDFNETADLIYGGAISGTGSVTQAGTGTLTLTGSNSFSGGLTINRGTLSVAEDANLGAPAGPLSLGDGTLESTASFSTNRNVVLTAYGSIQTDSGTTLIITGNINGNGLFWKVGTGTLVLTGANTWTGGVAISEGTLQATLPLPGDVSVFSGTLDGVLEVDGNLFNSGNVTVHGGDTTVGGSYTQESTGTLATSLGSKLAVTGNAALSGTLEVTGADAGYVANTHTDVLTAAGGVTGTFDQLVKDSGVVFTSTTIQYGPNEVWLDTTGLDITVAAAAMGIVEPAAVSAARRVQTGFEAINAITASGGTPSPDVMQGAGAIQHSATPTVAKATLESLSGQMHAASAAMLFDGINAGGIALSEHLDDLVSGRAGAGVWYGDLGWQGNLQRSGYAGASFRSSGGIAGADMRIGSHALLGVAAGQSRGFGQLDAAWDHNRTWMNNIAVYGGLMNGPWYASAQVANGWYREDMQRLLQLGALASAVGAESTGRYVAGALEAGRLFRIGGTQVVPFTDIRYQRLDLGGFSEQGGLGYGLTADARTAGRMQAGLGLRAERGWRLANGLRIQWDGSAAWRHTLHQYGSVFDASFTGFNEWLPVEGVGLSRNMGTLRAGLSLWPTGDFGLRVGFMRHQGQREHAGSAMLQGMVTF